MTTSTPAPTEPAPADTDAPRNRAARVSTVLATGAVCGILSVTGFGLLYLTFFTAVTTVCAIGAIVAGHVGRARGRRLGVGRTSSLVAIVVGWLALVVVAAAAVLFSALAVGLAALRG